MVDLESKYQVITYAVGDTKAGTKMGKLQLKNLTDESVMNCILWEEALNRIDPKTFRSGNIVKIRSASFNEKFNNCLISSLDLIEEAKTGISEEESAKLFQKIIDCIETFKDEKIKEFTLRLIKKHEDGFKFSPAAKLMHHNYIGGLLVHTAECVDFAELLYPKLNCGATRDEFLSAVILHDIGKVFEYKVDSETGIIEYNEDFRHEWISHSQYGFSVCMTEGQKKIAKMIAAHHSRTDWGAIIDLGEKDLEPYCYLVHHVDDLSAKFGKISINDL